jgi:hypothetical protein
MGRTRDDLHRLATHVLGRRRFEVSGRFGLRSSPGGLATPAFGAEPEVLRTAGLALIREVGSESRSVPLAGSTLAQLAAFAGADLGAAFSAGADTPAVGAPDEPLQLDAGEVAVITGWFELGWRVLDECLAQMARPAATLQLWPEHFDAGTVVDLGTASVNLGFSAGDGFCQEPYAYVGPWGPERPGDADYWNAPFGAYLPRSRADAGDDPGVFVRTGLDRLVGR